jgi:hypothetical protein
MPKRAGDWLFTGERRVPAVSWRTRVPKKSRMKNSKSLEILYLVNSTLLFIHEVDSGYWKEWQLFDLPGGIRMFLIMNIVLVMIGLVGFRM